MHSLKPKLQSYVKDLQESSILDGLLCEILEKPDDFELQVDIERIFQEKGIQYLSTPCHKAKHGSGAAIVADLSKGSLDWPDLHIPHKLEIAWGISRPKESSALKQQF